MSFYRSIGWRSLLVASCLSILPGLLSAQPYSADVTEDGSFEVPESMHDCTLEAMNPITNCSFETGVFTGWGIQEIGLPFFPLVVDIGGVSPGFGLFTSAPTQGTFAALNGFDGDGATGPVNTLKIFQDVDLPSGTTTMEFDYRGGWDMSFGGLQDRIFTVEVQPSGGGGALQSDLILTAMANTTVLDTGPSSASVDLSSFAGDSVRISFEWLIPEDFSGPGFFQLDNVLVTVVPDDPIVEVPTLSEVGLILMVLILVGSSLLALRRRRAAEEP